MTRKSKAEPFDIRDARLNGKPLLAHIGRALVELDRERTIDGASSVKATIRDPEYALLRSGALAKGVQLVAWNHTWTFVGMDENDDRSIVAAFESVRVNKYKQDRRRLSMKTTRPHFTQVALAGSPVLFPDQSRVRSATVGAIGVGLGASEKVTLRGKPATREQRVVLDEILSAAHEQGASVAELRGLVAAAIAETNALNIVPDGSTRGGVLRLPFNVAPTVAARDLGDVARWFVSGTQQGSAEQIAAKRLQRATSRYAPFVAQAAAIVSSFLRGDAVRVAKASALVKKQLTEKIALSVGTPLGQAGESRWDAVTNLWSNLGWYVYETATGFTVVTGQQISVAKPDLVLDPEDPGVMLPSFSEDESFFVNTLSCSILEEKVGSVQPGMVVDIVNYGNGNGRYIITSASDTTASRIVQLSLETPRAVTSGQDAGTKDTVDTSGVPDAVAKAYKRAVAIDKLGYGYMRPAPWDCSYAVSQLLIAGGAISGRLTTPSLASVGVAGNGKYMTFFNDPRPGNEGHVYVVFTMPGEGARRWEFHGPIGARGGWQGAGSLSHQSRYVARHIDGW